MNLHATAVSRWGSRFTLVFDPYAKHVLHSALGRWIDLPMELTIGVETETGEVVALPFTTEAEPFDAVEQELRLCGVRYKAHSVKYGIRLEVEVVAPFYPHNVQVSAVPLFLFTLKVQPQSRLFWTNCPHPLQRGKLVVRLKRQDTTFQPLPDALAMEYAVQHIADDRFALRDFIVGETPPLAQERIAPLTEGAVVEDNGIALPFDLSGGAEATLRFAWCSYVDAPVLEVFGKPMRFLYTRHWASVEEVARFAREETDTLLSKTAFIESLLDEASLSKSQLDLIRFSFQNFLLNTWWVVDDSGDEWFSVWEGSCYFHSTVDVEYNNGLVYFAFWLPLLERLLDEWARFEMQDEVGSYLAHDMGTHARVGSQAYPHPMQVEENANYLLMLHAFWRWTGNLEPARRHHALCRRLVDYFERSDTTGNGFPNRGVANTIDDASAAVQYAREQVYLAVKTLSACHAAAQLAQALGDSDWQAQCERIVMRIRETLDSQAWLGDHYAVCLERSAEGLTDPWTGEALHGELSGWDAYSLYTANGLLYLLMSGHTPPVDLWRIKQDIASAYRHALTEYGCTHTSADKSNVWLSQNLWRDFIAAYLDVGLPDNSPRYMAMEMLMNTAGLNKGFIDTYFTNNLCFYPRGITSVGYLFALCGLQIDRTQGLLRLRQRAPYPCRVPLLPLADWERGEVPFAVYRLTDEGIVASLEGEHLLDGLRVEWY
ncbi:MAG: glycoside hydrolase family 52 protein [Armatimonadota bacterium]|nr:glycoside hydrolase family 52 protein [Armatimonadota bacterium]